VIADGLHWIKPLTIKIVLQQVKQVVVERRKSRWVWWMLHHFPALQFFFSWPKKCVVECCHSPKYPSCSTILAASPTLPCRICRTGRSTSSNLSFAGAAWRTALLCSTTKRWASPSANHRLWRLAGITTSVAWCYQDNFLISGDDPLQKWVQGVPFQETLTHQNPVHDILFGQFVWYHRSFSNFFNRSVTVI